MTLGKWEIPFGKHKGTALEDIPAGYLLWLSAQDNPPLEVRKYVERHRKTLEEEDRAAAHKLRDRLDEILGAR